MVDNSQEYRLEYWATRSSVRSHRSLIRPLAHFAHPLARGKVNFGCLKMTWFCPIVSCSVISRISRRLTFFRVRRTDKRIEGLSDGWKDRWTADGLTNRRNWCTDLFSLMTTTTTQAIFMETNKQINKQMEYLTQENLDQKCLENQASIEPHQAGV